MHANKLCEPFRQPYGLLSLRLSSRPATINCTGNSESRFEVMEEGRKLVYTPQQSIKGTMDLVSGVVEDFQERLAVQAEDGLDAYGCASTTFKPRRAFCGTCRKAQSLCICVRIKTVVDNRIGITILQHPEEKDHHLGSARIAALSLQKVQVLSIPEADGKFSYRIRTKVVGSKRSITGRVGNKGKIKISSSIPAQPAESLVGTEGESVDTDQDMHLIPAWMNLPPGAGLLFPSDKAIDLVPNLSEGDHERPCPTHLVVLDGTWSKAKRIYFENPWLHKLPHYNLPLSAPSMYGPVRRQPKPGCLSTVESIVFALRILEPETQGLDALLEVFDSMINDAKGFQEQTEQKIVDQNAGRR